MVPVIPRERTGARPIARACRAAEEWVGKMSASWPLRSVVEWLVDESVWTNDQLTYAAVISAFSLSLAWNAFAITPLIDEVAYACRIVL